jgi:outer membrane lipoprotein-sorting protein
VEEYDLGKERGMVDQFLLLGFGSSSKELQNAYSIRLGGPETVAGEKATRIELTPKSADVLAHLKKVDLWISDATGVAVQQKFYEPGGDYSMATYTNIKTDANIPDSALRLNLPRDVRRQRPQK